MGHPAPFNLKMIGVGNEQWGPQYSSATRSSPKRLKAKHPEIQLVSERRPVPAGEPFDYALAELRELKADIVDEHYYKPPAWFLDNAHRYDNYDRARGRRSSPASTPRRAQRRRPDEPQQLGRGASPKPPS